MYVYYIKFDIGDLNVMYLGRTPPQLCSHASFRTIAWHWKTRKIPAKNNVYHQINIDRRS